MGSFPTIDKVPTTETIDQKFENQPVVPFSYLRVRENQPKIEYLSKKSKAYKEFTLKLKSFLSHNPKVNVLIKRRHIINWKIINMKQCQQTEI